MDHPSSNLGTTAHAARGGTTSPARGPGRSPAVLFTAFEPSGDDHAAAVIAVLRKRHADLPIFAWGGPKMVAAGATIVERTGDEAVMGMPGFDKIREHQRINARIDAWLSSNPVALHVPVDSPAANFPICAIAKAHGVRVVHLVAPQIWAWARWRIRKLRRLTDLVLCILPFEERFFARRRVPAKFVGHFLFDEPIDGADLDRRASSLPAGHPRLAVMPGSRPDEIQRNFPLMIDVISRLRARCPDLRVVIAATRPEVERTLRTMAAALGPPGENGWPAGVTSVVADTDAAVRWCDAALVKSGTVTLQVARQLKPMVIVYKKHNPAIYLLAKSILATRHFALPNVIAGRRVVPEFVPHYGGGEPIAAELLKLLQSPEAADAQRRDLAAIADQFKGRSARVEAADAVEFALGLTPA